LPVRAGLQSPRGNLVIVGGGPIGADVKGRFVELAGGAGRARIDESTALVVEPSGWWSVIGQSVVTIYDARRSAVAPRGRGPLGASDVRLHVIPAGGRFDPNSGLAVLPF
jgi:hypothetical protein